MAINISSAQVFSLDSLRSVSKYSKTASSTACPTKNRLPKQAVAHGVIVVCLSCIRCKSLYDFTSPLNSKSVH